MKYFFAFLMLFAFAPAKALIDSVKSFTGNSVAKHFRYETGIAVSDTLMPPFVNPYDSSQVNMYAIFTSPSGKKYRRNAFYFQPYERHFDRPNNIEIPGGNCSIGWNDVAEYEYPDANAFMVPINTNYPWRVRFALHSSKNISKKTTSIY